MQHDTALNRRRGKRFPPAPVLTGAVLDEIEEGGRKAERTTGT